MNEEEVQFTERVLSLLESDIEEQMENNLRSEVLVADWRSFEEVIGKSQASIIQKER